MSRLSHVVFPLPSCYVSSLIMPTTRRSIFAMELDKLLVHGKITALFQTAVMSAKHYVSNATTKINFEKLIC